MHLHIGFMDFLVFGLYLIIWKAVLHFVQVESRRGGSTVTAGVSGLLA